MSQDNDPFMEAAQRVLESDDPVAELLELGRLETRRRRRLRCIKLGSAAAILLVAVGALWIAAWNEGWPPEAAQRTVLEDSAWMRHLTGNARQGDLPAADEARLREFLSSDSSLRRRGAVGVLSTYGKEIDPHVLDEIAFELTESIDVPLVVAARGGGHLSDALYRYEQATRRQIATAIWYHCARTHSYPRVGTIEKLLESGDEEVRSCCCRALGEIHGYVVNDELRVRLEADSIAVIQAARRLLEKGK